MTDQVIRSRQNPTLKYIRSLQRRDRRQKERAFVVEGSRPIRDALHGGHRPDLILCAESFDVETIFPLFAGETVRFLSDLLFNELSDTTTPQGILAVFPFPEIPAGRTENPLTLIVDGLQDPGNLGTLLRSAAGVPCSSVYFTAGTVDPYSPKVVRSAAGAHFLIPIAPLPFDQFDSIANLHQEVILADASGDRLYDEIDMTVGAAVLVGSEASGPSPKLRSLATLSVAIPLAGGMESLNAGVAGSIILFEASRQRRAVARGVKTSVIT